MDFIHSLHWQRKKRFRWEITEYMIEYAIKNANAVRDKRWPDLLNAICVIIPPGRPLKVVYRREQGRIKIITAYWMD